MKVKISFTIDVDVDAWMLDYSVERAEVREDVKVYVENGTLDHLRGLGMLVAEPQFKREVYGR